MHSAKTVFLHFCSFGRKLQMVEDASVYKARRLLAQQASVHWHPIALHRVFAAFPINSEDELSIHFNIGIVLGPSLPRPCLCYVVSW
jgi:hypothetical protein